MRSKKKYLLVLFLIVTGTALYLYAQSVFQFHKPAPESNLNQQATEQVEYAGEPTNDDPWKEIDKLIKVYYDKHGVSFKGKVKLIDDNSDKEKIIEEDQFEYSISGADFYYRLGQIEVVNNHGLALLADHSNKFITASFSNTPATPAKKIFDISEFKKLMEERKADAKVTQLGEEKILTIDNIVDPQIQGYRIYYNPQTYQVSKMLIGMLRLSPLDEDEGGVEDISTSPDQNNEKSNNENSGNADEIETYTYYLEITYDEMKILDLTAVDFTPEKKFIVINKDKIELAQNYKNYQLVVNGMIENEIEKANNEEE